MTDAEELARKKKVRGGHRASTTQIFGQIEPAVTGDFLDVSKVNQLKRSLEEKLRSLSRLDDEILNLTSEEVIEEIIQADEVKEHIYTALSKLELTLKPPPPTVVPHTRPPAVRTEPSTVALPTMGPTIAPTVDLPLTDSSMVNRSPEPTPPVRGAKVKLPTISLLRFNGDPVKWTSFWDSYHSAVHLNSELSEVDKFNYLRSLLDHTAFDAIAGLTLSSANYHQAIEILHKRFGDKQVIISKHMDTLMNMATISSDRNLKDLCRLYDHIETHVRSLKSLGIEAASYGALLSPVILAKLPPDLQLIVSRKVSSANLDMEALLITFEEELTARERANPQFSRRAHETSHGTATALFSGCRDSSKNDNQCSYCQQPHSSSNCTSVANPTERKRILKTSAWPVF